MGAISSQITRPKIVYSIIYDAENVSIWWRHHEMCQLIVLEEIKNKWKETLMNYISQCCLMINPSRVEVEISKKN